MRNTKSVRPAVAKCREFFVGANCRKFFMTFYDALILRKTSVFCRNIMSRTPLCASCVSALGQAI